MRIARIEDAAGVVWLARIDDEMAVPVRAAPSRLGADAVRDALAEDVELATAPGVADPVPLSEARLLTPLTSPQKVVAIGLNYADHARESDMELPDAPVVFAKFTSSIVGPDQPVRFRKQDATEVDFEAELAAVIGRRARDVDVVDALGHVYGYTLCNDVSARDAQFADGQWIRGKSFDTFCPLGPWIVTGDEVGDPQGLGIRCRVNGELLQNGTTKDMVFSVAELVSYLSRFMTLEPGDVIATGTPVGVGFARDPAVFLGDGDVVEVEADRVGVLRNPVQVG